MSRNQKRGDIIKQFKDFSYETDTLYTMVFEQKLLLRLDSGYIDNLGINDFKSGSQKVCAHTNNYVIDCTVITSKQLNCSKAYPVEVKDIKAKAIKYDS